MSFRGYRKRGRRTPDIFARVSCGRGTVVPATGSSMIRKTRDDLWRPEILRPNLHAARRGRPDDLRPMVRMDVAAVAPLADRGARLSDVCGHRLGVAVPHVEDFLEML